MKLPKLIIMGYGGHARSVADIAIECGYSDLIFIDENAEHGECFFDFKVKKSINDVNIQDSHIFPASGNNEKRSHIMNSVKDINSHIVSLISPKAHIGFGSTIENGCLIGHYAHVGPMAKVGQGCIINTSAVLEHECIVGDFSHISVNATMAGRSRLGEFSMLGAGGVILDGIDICENVIIGAGGVVNRGISVPGTYVGVPVERIS